MKKMKNYPTFNIFLIVSCLFQLTIGVQVDERKIDILVNQPACEHPIYCNNTLLCTVQLSHIFQDSKTFVDKPLLQPVSVVLAAFEAMGNSPTVPQIQTWLDTYFTTEGSDLIDWTPTDAGESPAWLDSVTDPHLAGFAKNLISIWPTLGRQYNPDYASISAQSSLLHVPNGFIVPGGRFREFYYWDTYFILEGLYLSNMQATARGMIENLLLLVQQQGFVPNGGRVYYLNRSQPPMLSLMVRQYWNQTHDLDFLKSALPILDQEYQFWQTNRSVQVSGPDGTVHQLNVYGSSLNLPRPEGWVEDVTIAQNVSLLPQARSLWNHIAAAAETGWDFSSRWCRVGSDLSTLQTPTVVPVDLNAILFAVEDALSLFHGLLGEQDVAAHYRTLAVRRLEAIEAVLWNDAQGFWNDYHLETGSLNDRYFYVSNVVPLWTGAYIPSHGRTSKILAYLQDPSRGILSYPGGIPTSLMFDSSQQWDFPNAWPPEQLFLIQGLRNILALPGDDTADRLALNISQRWINSNYLAWVATNGGMFEKYNVTHLGIPGGGGEYPTQTGFGWSNGVVLQLLNMYPNQLTSPPPSEVASDTPAPSSIHHSSDDSYFTSDFNPFFCTLPTM